MADPAYLIMAGVRRAVAARELGLATIPATITAGPDKGMELDIPLDELYSPKERISRSDQIGRYNAVEQATADPAIRLKIPRIEIVPLRPNRLKYYTRLQDVALDA